MAFANSLCRYGSAYLLTACGFQLIFGKLYTFYPLKWVFLIALGIFEIGSLVCGAAPTSTDLIIGRAVAGLGSAGIFSGAILIIAQSVPLHRRPVYTGIISAMYGIASVAGPLMGGAFTDILTWRWCFYINLPFGGFAAVFILLLLPEPKKDRPARLSLKEQILQMDVEGSLCFLPGVIALLLALQWGGSKYAWSDGRIIGLFIVFGVLLIAFVAIQVWKQEKATVPPRVFMNRSIWSCALYITCFGGSFFIILYYVS
jgi:MFS family permease